MERRGLAAAIGCVSGIVAAVSLFGLVEASVVGVGLALLALRASGAVLEPSGEQLSRVSQVALPVTVLISLGVLRAGAASLDAVRGANSVLGPAAITTPGPLAAATFLACIAVVITAPRFSFKKSLGSGLQMTCWVLTGLLVVTVSVGPTLDSLADVITWVSTSVVVLAAMSFARDLSERPRAATSAIAISAISVGMAAFA